MRSRLPRRRLYTGEILDHNIRAVVAVVDDDDDDAVHYDDDAIIHLKLCEKKHSHHHQCTGRIFFCLFLRITNLLHWNKIALYSQSMAKKQNPWQQINHKSTANRISGECRNKKSFPFSSLVIWCSTTLQFRLTVKSFHSTCSRMTKKRKQTNKFSIAKLPVSHDKCIAICA